LARYGLFPGKANCGCSGMDKLDLYGQVVSDLFADQLGWICDRGHRRRLTEG
jgi:hypothetical protein